MEIDARKNGIHSLAEALRAFKSFHDNPNDIYALKDSILRTHHAFETLFKHLLFLQNPVFLLDDDVKVKDFVTEYEKWERGDLATVVDELRTITLEAAIRRLQGLGVLKELEPKELGIFLDSVKKLTFYRNKLQHFAIRAEPDIIGGILGNVLPRGIDLLNSLYPKHFMVTEKIVLMNPLLRELQTLYDKSPEVIELLRHDYDRLIQEAIKFFEKKAFDDQILKLRIADHGRVGPPPYFPELFSEGFLSFKYDTVSIMESARSLWLNQDVDTSSYKAEINISEPKLVKEETDNFATVQGNLEYNSNMVVDRAERSLVLPEASEKISILKALNVTFRISFDYVATALWTPAHFNVEKITKGNGQLLVNLSAIPKGYRRQEAEITGKYQVNLNETSSPFRLHCFVNPDKSLNKQSPHMLEWSINAKGKLEFI